MYLSPQELEKMTLHNIGFLAQKRLARGLKLNYPEAVALIATVLLEMMRDGRSTVPELMETGRQLLGRRQVLSGVPEMLSEVHIEGTFADGTKLVAVRQPIANEQGDLKMALYGSFLPIPDISVFGEDEPQSAGTISTDEGAIVLNANRATVSIEVQNTDVRPIQIGSHFNFVEANARLLFDRAAAYGKRLDIPAGAAIRLEPGETRTVTLVEIAGNKIIRGGNNLADGAIGEDHKTATLQRVQDRAFANRN